MTLPYRDGPPPIPPSAEVLIAEYGEPDDFAAASELTNAQRVEVIRPAVDAFARERYASEDLSAIAGDMISYILHVVAMEGGDVTDAYESAWLHFVNEVGRGYAS